MRKIVTRIDQSFLNVYPEHNSRFPQGYCNRILMPIAKYPRGVPEADETCTVLITQEDRWFYNRFHAAAQKKEENPDVEIDPQALMQPETNYGLRLVIRIYKMDPPSQTPATFSLHAFQSDGKATRMKSVPHDEPPPDCEEIAGGFNSSSGTHWTRIAVLLRTIPSPSETDEHDIDEMLFEHAK